ncbi:hypothetical protein JIN85_17940 [Luteolibacter pohnpeiensis]|uniref:LamG-like jellyroll fold domain-containing protein n=1 Tax=Luteolibacter pohnpeiensis TaxID=454153 RepID=A0A934S7U8_9BACT|nr:LamG-like jellyroll fold domain-containing protein [Luteolibacter pohnpeiensis]MBK1884306.1 hypothetical protein [Luteolibacter pohnpeiensis]
MKQVELENRILELLDGQASAAQVLELEEILKADPEARSVYRSLSRLHSALCVRYEAAAEVQAVLPIAPFQSSQNEKPKRVLPWILAAAAAVAIAVLVLSKNSGGANSVPYQLSPGSVCQVTYPDGVKGPEGHFLVDGAYVELLGGNFECSLANGVHLVVEGPAEFTLANQDLVLLNQGNAWFDVPEVAKGFSVRTHEVDVVDLESEFGVLALSDAPDQIHVLRGSVIATTRIGTRSSEVLTAGQARVVNHDGSLKTLPPTPGRFQKALSGKIPYLHFGLDGIGVNGEIQVDGSMPGASSIKARLISEDSASHFIPGPVGQAISFSSGSGAWINTDWPGLSGKAPRSIAFWFKIDPGAQQTDTFPAAIAWGNPDNHFNRKWKIWFPRDPDNGQLRACISFGADRYYDPARLDDGSWHHLTAIYTGKTHEDGTPDCLLYLDGVLSKPEHRFGPDGPPVMRNVDTQTGGPGNGPLRIGYGIYAGLPTFQGSLDEIYIYQGVIDEKTIRSLSSNGHPSDGK